MRVNPGELAAWTPWYGQFGELVVVVTAAVMWSGKREMQAGGGEFFAGGLECYGWETVCRAEETGEGSAERMADEPEVGLRVEVGDVGYEFLLGEKGV